jgi:hypothetical protein
LEPLPIQPFTMIDLNGDHEADFEFDDANTNKDVLIEWMEHSDEMPDTIKVQFM